MRTLAIALCTLLVSGGCYSTAPVVDVDLRRQLPVTKQALILPTADGSTVRVDPNSELRFLLHSGEVTPWTRGRDLWRSDLGISFEQPGGTLFVAWDEVAGVEVRNLSGGKTFAAVFLGTVIVGLAIVAIVASLKGGSSGISSGSSSSASTKTRVKHSSFSRRPVMKRRPLRRSGGGAHLHVPLSILITEHHYRAHLPRDASPPPPAPPAVPPEGPVPAPPPPGAPVEEGVTDIHAEQAQVRRHEAEGAAGAASRSGAAPPREPQRAQPLFQGRLVRRSSIELISAAAAGTELVRFGGYSGSFTAGLRLRETIELAGGVRHTIEPLGDGHGSGVVGFGRFGVHLWLDDNQRVALPMSIDAGAGYHVEALLKLNLGLRVRLTHGVTLGLMPFNPLFQHFKDDSPFRGASRWTFPTTLELGFAY